MPLVKFRSRRGIAGGWVVLTTSVTATLLLSACGGASHSASAPKSAPASSAATTTSLPDVSPTPADFVNINRMTRVGDHFVGSINGNLAAVLAVARNPKGGVYPVGAVVQLIPTEAMVKRRHGYSPATGDWEFFALKVSAAGTEIQASGAHVRNFFGGDCSSCHRVASHFDFICGKNHGCPPLPVTDALISKIQQSDPRPRQ